MGKQVSRLVVFLICLSQFVAPATSPSRPQESKASPALARDGRKLMSAMDTLRVTGVGAPALSHDGQRVAYTVTEVTMEPEKEWKSVTHVWVVPTAGGVARQFTRGDKNATSPEWSPDGKHIAFLSDREKDGERQVWFIGADGGEAWKVTSHKGGVTGFRFSPDGRQLVLTAVDQPSKEEEQRKKDKDDTILIDRDFKMSHLWIWDIEKKEGKRLTEGDFTTSDPRWSPDGTRISFISNPTPRADDGGLTDIWILTLAGGEKRKLVENPGSDSGARWSPDGKWIAYVGNKDIRGGISQNHLFLVSSSGGSPRKLTESFELDAGTPLWSPDGKTLYFSSTIRQASEIFACDVATGSTRQTTRHSGSLNLSDRAGSTTVGIASDSRRAQEIYRADSSFQSIELITKHNSWLEGHALGEVETMHWKSRDGLAIEGVLTKPVGYETGKKYPFLLNPHGGPTGASLTSFDSTAQLFAANGYLVLEPNFRGSTGKGEKFAGANKNGWGKGDYEDCMTGVDAVIERGLADPERMGAFGWSYGGYMTFWILTQTDRFKAVSPGAGLTNIYSMYSQNDIQRYLRWFYGDKSPWDNTQLYWDSSPMKHIKQVKTPTMIMHGQNDTRVPIAQAQEFYRALIEMNVPVEFVVYPREGHGINEPRHRLDRMRRYLAFFGKHLNNPPVTEPPAEKAKPSTGPENE